MDLTTTPPRPGERWVLRHRLPDGRATDLTGWIGAVGPDVLEVDTVGGRVRVPLACLVAARRVPAAAGGPPPSRTPAAELERIALPGWAAITEPLGEWTLRAAGGFTGRANSCLAVGDPGRPVADAADRIIDFAAQHEIVPWAQVMVGSAEEGALVGLGWRGVYAVVDVLAVRLADLLGSTLADPAVRVSDVLSQEWLAADAESRPSDAQPAGRRLILDSGHPRAFASVSAVDQIVAIGRGHEHRGWLGLAALWTRPDHRRRGLAGQIVFALGHWAARRDARWAYLQVDRANPAAAATYRRLGFRPHHTYRYLQAPEALPPAQQVKSARRSTIHPSRATRKNG